MIFQKSDIVPYETTGGMDTVAVRMPDHPLAQALIRAWGRAMLRHPVPIHPGLPESNDGFPCGRGSGWED